MTSQSINVSDVVNVEYRDSKGVWHSADTLKLGDFTWTKTSTLSKQKIILPNNIGTVVKYFNYSSKYVIVTTRNLYYSDTGDVWTKIDFGLPSTDYIKFAQVIDSKLYIFSYNNIIVVNTNFTYSSTYSSILIGQIKYILYYNGLYWFYFSDKIVKTSDIKTFTVINTSIPYEFTDMTVNSSSVSKYYMFGITSDGIIYNSKDGENWSKFSTLTLIKDTNSKLKLQYFNSSFNGFYAYDEDFNGNRDKDYLYYTTSTIPSYWTTYELPKGKVVTLFYPDGDFNLVGVTNEGYYYGLKIGKSFNSFRKLGIKNNTVENSIEKCFGNIMFETLNNPKHFYVINYK